VVKQRRTVVPRKKYDRTEGFNWGNSPVEMRIAVARNVLAANDLEDIRENLQVFPKY